MALESGRVVASFGRTVQVEDAGGQLVDCSVFGRRLEIVCADRVRFERGDPATSGIVHERLPRDTVVSRVNARGEAETLAANATQLVIVLADPPLPDFYLVDRYLAAADAARIPAVVVLNKVEGGSTRLGQCRLELEGWRRLGYATLEVSALTGAGLPALATALRARTSLLLGQSGVGKSTLLNSLVPGAAAHTRAIVAKTGKGSHTTSRTTLFRIPGGGELLDSPGVRDFAPGPDLLHQTADGFREIGALAAACRFKNCRHVEEPECAVRAAAQSGAIAERRYRSYRQLLELMDRLARKRRGY
jgi:ribosome biogenesis GTPase